MPAIGHFILHSQFTPQITAGFYTLKTEQRGLPFDVEPETTHVHVAAPRYVMPTDQILSSFPPANAEGAFGDRLPQICLKRRTLPWERNPAGGADVNPLGTPWLALVVVAEGEAELSGTTPVADCVTQGTVLHQPEDQDVAQGVHLVVTESVVKKIFPTLQDLPLLTHVREVDVDDTELVGGDDDGWVAVVLANRMPVFDVAGGKPVRYMACLVNVEGQLQALPKPQPAFESFTWGLAQDWRGLATTQAVGHVDAALMGQLAVDAGALPSPAVFRNTRPSAQPKGSTFQSPKPVAQQAIDGGQAVVQPHVAAQWQVATAQVALSATAPDAKRLVRDTMGLGFRLPIGLYAKEKVLRFPVLAHWSFTTSEGATFETLMQDLDVGLLGTLPVPPKAEPGKPLPPPQPDTAPEVVQTGHVGLDHRTRRGDALRAWYRGPCVPVATARDGAGSAKPLPLAHAADQLRRVVPDGREDVTLAAAFEIGRLLALSQLSVVSALLRFRAEQYGAGRVREMLQLLVPFKLPKSLSNAGAKSVDLGRFVSIQLIDVLAKNPERMLGPQRPIADPGREIKVEGEIDRLIANGLGLDYELVMKRSAELGVLGALSRTAVPVAGPVGSGKFGESEQALLADALTAELNRTLAVAMPAATPGVTPGVIPGVLPGGTLGPAVRTRSAGQQRDALDDLIDQAGLVAHDDGDAASDGNGEEPAR
jgi:hypothetical protein